MDATLRPDYPPELERAWLDMAAEALGTTSDFATLQRLTPLASDLSDAFTTERQPGFQDYSSSREHWLAYGTFFFPQTFIRMRFVLEECLATGRWRPPSANGPVRLLDLGAGTGAATAAVVLALKEHAPRQPVDLLAVDASGTALDLLSALFVQSSPTLHVDHTDTRVASIRGFQSAGIDGTWDLITVSFALNEVLESASPDAAEQWVREALSHLSPGGLLVILEPALHAACERMEQLRDKVSSLRLARIVGPCPHHQPCPMLPMAETWCHDVRRWRVPESVEYINRKLQRSVQYLKFCYLALANEPTQIPEPRGIEFCRIVAPMSDPRGRICTFGCAADGSIHPYEVQTRDLNGDGKRSVLAMERGDCVTWREPRVLGDGRTVRGVPAL